MDVPFRESSPSWEGSKALRRAWEAVDYWLGQRDWPEPPDLSSWSLPGWLQAFLESLGKGLAAVFGFFAQLTAWQLSLLLLLPLLVLAYQLWHRSQRRAGLGWVSSRPQAPEDSALLTGSAADWLAQAQADRQAQRYDEACRALYFALLLKLDETQLVPQQPSRTDREYRYLTQDLPQPDGPHLLLETHERLCFSTAPASLGLFERCLEAYGEAEQQIEQWLQQRLAQQQLAQQQLAQQPLVTTPQKTKNQSRRQP